MNSNNLLSALVLLLVTSLLCVCEGSNVTAYVVKIPGYTLDLPWAKDCSFFPKTCLPDLPALPQIPGGANPAVSSIVGTSFSTVKGVIDAVAPMIPPAQPYLVTELPPINKDLMNMNMNSLLQFAYFGGYLILTAAVGTVLGLVLTCVMLLFFICWFILLLFRFLCARRRSTAKGLNVKALIIRWIPAIIILAAFVLPLAGTYIGLTYNDGTSTGFSNLIGVGLNFANDALDTVQGAFDWIDQLFEDLEDQVDGILDFLTGVLVILDPMHSISDILGDLQGEISSLKNMTLNAASNITDIVDLLQYMAEAAEKQGAHIDMPSAGDVPSISGDQLGQIDTAVDNIGTVRDSIDDMIDQANNTLSGLSSQIGDQINSALSDIRSQVDEQLSQFKDMKQMGDDYLEAYTPYANDVRGYERYRNYVWAITFIVPVIVFVATLLLFVFNWKPIQFIPCFGLWLIAALILLFVWIYFLLYGVEYTVATIMSETCELHEMVIRNVTDVFAGEMIDQFKEDLKMKDFSVMDILKCSGNQTLVGIVGLDNMLNVSDLTDPMFNEIESQKDQIGNMTSPIEDAKSQITAFSNVSQLDFGSGFNISDIRAQLQDIVVQLSDLSKFNFSASMIDDAISSVNDLTCPVTINGIDYCFYYTFDNISTLDPDLPPYDQDPTLQQQLRDKIDSFQDTLDRFAEINSTIDGLKLNISIIDGKLAGIDEAFSVVLDLGSTIQDYTGQISNQLDIIVNITDDIKDNITTIIDNLRDFVGQIDGWTSLTGCSFIGELYEGLEYNICEVITTSFEVMAAGHFVIGMGLTVLFFLFCIGSACVCDCKRAPKVTDKKRETDDL